MILLLLGVLVVFVVVLAMLQGMLSARTAVPLDGDAEDEAASSVDPVPSLVSRIALPLGRKHDGVVCFREAKAGQDESRRRLLVFLQGNAMDPWDEYAEFTRRGWSVLAVGYTDTLTGSARNVLRAVDAHTREHEYDDVAVWARSIGTCFAPELCARAACRDRLRWAAYVTPVSSVGDLTGFGGAAATFTEGAELGFARAQDAVPHHVLLASEDQVTPAAPVARMIRDGRVPEPASVRVAQGYGHNNVTMSAERAQMLDQLLVGK